MTAVRDRAEFDYRDPGRPVLFDKQQTPVIALVDRVEVGDDRLDETGRIGIARSLYFGPAASLDAVLPKGFITLGKSDRASLAFDGCADLGRDFTKNIGAIGPSDKPLPVTFDIAHFSFGHWLRGGGIAACPYLHGSHPWAWKLGDRSSFSG
jgi:hypothetical protein